MAQPISKIESVLYDYAKYSRINQWYIHFPIKAYPLSLKCQNRARYWPARVRCYRKQPRTGPILTLKATDPFFLCMGYHIQAGITPGWNILIKHHDNKDQFSHYSIGTISMWYRHNAVGLIYFWYQCRAVRSIFLMPFLLDNCTCGSWLTSVTLLDINWWHIATTSRCFIYCIKTASIF